MKIGLVGEAPNDTVAIQNLLSQKYTDCDFVTLLDRVNGSMLDNKKAIKSIRREYELESPNLVIFIRDLDALEHDAAAKAKRSEVFRYSNSIVDKRGILLLNIYELEALILADIETFNRHYESELPAVDDPMKVPMPKEELIKATHKCKWQYQESHCPLLFSLLKFDLLVQNCRYFSDFIIKFDKAVGVDIPLHSIPVIPTQKVPVIPLQKGPVMDKELLKIA